MHGCVNDWNLVHDWNCSIQWLVQEYWMFVRLSFTQGQRAKLLGDSSRYLAIWLSMIKHGKPAACLH